VPRRAGKGAVAAQHISQTRTLDQVIAPAAGRQQIENDRAAARLAAQVLGDVAAPKAQQARKGEVAERTTLRSRVLGKVTAAGGAARSDSQLGVLGDISSSAHHRGGLVGGVPAFVLWSAVCGVAVTMGVLLGHGWLWPLLFLAGVVVGGVLMRRPWLVVGMIVATGALLSAPDGFVEYLGLVWLSVSALLGAAAVVGGVRRCVPAGATVLWHLALLLPRRERDFWRAEVHAVLHACASDIERSRQVRGFLVAVPVTVVTSWRVRR
jgi:hypothetical protein